MSLFLISYIPFYSNFLISVFKIRVFEKPTMLILFDFELNFAKIMETHKVKKICSNLFEIFLPYKSSIVCVNFYFINIREQF